VVAPYLLLCWEDAPQWAYPLREVLNAARPVVRTGVPWRYLPHDFPPWSPVYEQTQRWIWAGCFEAQVGDAGVLLRGRSGIA
jgi:transposase